MSECSPSSTLSVQAVRVFYHPSLSLSERVVILVDDPVSQHDWMVMVCIDTNDDELSIAIMYMRSYLIKKETKDHNRNL